LSPGGSLVTDADHDAAQFRMPGRDQARDLSVLRLAPNFMRTGLSPQISSRR
jgi:hypothetical protein